MKKLLILTCCLFLLSGCAKKEEKIEEVINEEPTKKEVSIINTNSNSRPYAVVINNTPVAVKVQTGLQKAYMVYSIPVEGNMTRLLAFYKDIEELKVGTIRSARHNFLDYAYEQDAILVHFGWSHYAQSDIKKLGYNNINGLSDAGFYRENKENLATEHTAYTNISNMINVANNKNYKTTTDKGLVLNYDTNEIDLSSENITAKNVVVPSSNTLNASYIYDETENIYKRSVNGISQIDYETKKQITTKNIIIQKINTKMASDNYYWDLETTGKGTGVYITNGYAKKITWEKESRTSKTIYKYLDGSPVILNDGNTFIELQSTKQEYTIN